MQNEKAKTNLTVCVVQREKVDKQVFNVVLAEPCQDKNYKTSNQEKIK